MNLQHIANWLLFPVGIGGGLIAGTIMLFTSWKQGFSNPKLELSLWKKIVLVIIFAAACFELVLVIGLGISEPKWMLVFDQNLT